ncbi:VOC family protein [Portibacter marinus]|uniref:VOC family protein n=1 Tax=Portibacter marinus TaxID=2898660 RepID=UPI001F2E9581|nr:VOC family protein [Portibacter marinus]
MHNISSIQQVGLGSADVQEVYKWYKKHLCMNIQVFSEKAEAKLMSNYTGGKIHSRHAILALNKFGGGGIEFWQFTSRDSEPVSFKIKPGDLGISMMKMKVSNIEEAFARIKELEVNIYYEVGDNIMDPSSFAFQDPFGNDVQMIESSNWYDPKRKDKQGGVIGVTIGVTDMDQSISFYKELLNFDIVRNLHLETYKDLDNIAGEKLKYKRVVLEHSKPRKGPFAKLLGSNEIELIQVLDREPNKIFDSRYWGDQGFIHLCFDVQRMSALKKKFAGKNIRFTVDSSDSFDMGKAAGRFAYIEDPDGTLIEFVETHKIPIIPWLGWYYTVPKDLSSSLPDWLFRLMFFFS